MFRTHLCVIYRLVSGWDSETPLDVELGKVVRQVQVDQKKRHVKIRTTDRKSITADVVVVAVPLGVLKNGDLFFDPPLSAERKNAINKMGKTLGIQTILTTVSKWL